MSNYHYYIWLSSTVKTHSIPSALNEYNITLSEYNITLPFSLWLHDEWELALCDLTYHRNFTSVPIFSTVCCDLVESNIIGGVEAQVLRRLLLGATSLTEYQFQQLQYIRIIPSNITAVRLSLLDEKAIPIELDGWVYCTLHIRKKNPLL